MKCFIHSLVYKNQTAFHSLVNNFGHLNGSFLIEVKKKKLNHSFIYIAMYLYIVIVKIVKNKFSAAMFDTLGQKRV